LKTSLFDFTLPEELIAHQPPEKRDGARLLHVQQDMLSDAHVTDLIQLLTSDDVLVFNNTRVIPARLFVQREQGAPIEILLHQQMADGVWRAFARPAKKLRIYQKLHFTPHFSAIVQEKCDDGQVVLAFTATGEEFWQHLEQAGHVPLPPYISRNQAHSGDRAEDKERYQTIYAQHKGSVAAPTAGLHFSQDLLQRLTEQGIEQYFITLHVGAGTFQPVKVEDVRDHKMHSERGIISPSVADRLNVAKRAGKRIVAVGTTSMRTIESATDADGIIHPFDADTDIFITPSYQFRAIDRLITNFHLPKSTLFMLVCAFSGTERMKAAYHHAINKGYRFYSYGDACLLDKCAS
jgi:S-adenosylmethionine:tRNA ribosyltransferase-isomerase